MTPEGPDRRDQNEVLAAIASLDTKVAVILAEQRHLLVMVAKHDRWLSGNGFPGMRAQMWGMWAMVALFATQIDWKEVMRTILR